MNLSKVRPLFHSATRQLCHNPKTQLRFALQRRSYADHLKGPNRRDGAVEAVQYRAIKKSPLPIFGLILLTAFAIEMVRGTFLIRSCTNILTL